MDQLFIETMRKFIRSRTQFDKLCDILSDYVWDPIAQIYDAFSDLLCDKYGWDPDWIFEPLWAQKDDSEEALKALFGELNKNYKAE